MARKSPAQEAVALQIEFSPIGRTRVRTHCRAGLRRARHLTRDRAAPAVVTNGGKGESARILTFPTEWAYITGRTGHQAAAA